MLFGKTDTEAKDAELHNVQSSIIGMMRDNDLREIPNPICVPTNDMSAFPDVSTARPIPAMPGYRLVGHDRDGNGQPDTNYVGFRKTLWTYSGDLYGVVTQGPKADN